MIEDFVGLVWPYVKCVMRSREMLMKDIIRAMLIGILFLVAIGLVNSCAAMPLKDDEALSRPLLFWPLPPEPPRIEYLMSIARPGDLGMKKSFLVRLFLGESVERIVKPYGIVRDREERIIITDTGKRSVHVFDTKRNRYSQIPKNLSERLGSPVGVTVDSEGRVYVTDSQLKRVNIYDRDGRLLSVIEKDFERPTGIAINQQERLLYVVDTLLNKVVIFDLEGRSVGGFGKRGGGEGEFNFPTNIFIDNEGLVYVTDSMNFKIQIFNKEGVFLNRFGRHGDGSGDFSSPKGVAVDSEGNIYVVDTLFDNVQIFDREGRFLLAFGRTGSGRGEFWLPTGIFIDDLDRIYVADSYNSRVQVFQFLGSSGEAAGKNSKHSRKSPKS